MGLIGVVSSASATGLTYLSYLSGRRVRREGSYEQNDYCCDVDYDVRASFLRGSTPIAGEPEEKRMVALEESRFGTGQALVGIGNWLVR